MIEILNFYKFSKRLFENHKRIVHDRSKKELQKENIIILFDTISYLCNILRELSVIFYGVMYSGMNIGMVIAMLNITSFFGEIARAFGEYQQTGAIFFDNKKQSEEELKGNTAYVDQENILLEGTVIDNITGFSEEPNEKLVAGLLDELGLEEWVATLANRMYHNLSSELTNLSGEERQRLSISRALYKNCPITVMDENNCIP